MSQNNSMINAIIYARVSSKEQESECFSIPAQIKLLNEYAIQNGLKEKVAQGGYLGSAPFGHINNKDDKTNEAIIIK